MGLLDSVMGAVSAATGGQTSGGADLMQMASNLLSQQSGGLQGLVSVFTSNGLGDVVSSWVGKGANLPVSADQIMSALGGPVQSLASSLGQSPDQVAGLLSEHLPGLIDQLTPDGEVPAEGGLASGLSALKGLLG